MAAKAPGYANCVGLWKMNEASWTPDQAGDVKDSSGQGNHGMAKGDAATDAGGKIDRCGIFDGTGDYIRVPHATGLQFGTGSYSFSVWFKAPSGDTYRHLIFKGDDSYAPYYGVRLWPTLSRIRSYIRGSNGNTVGIRSAGSGYDDNSWHHLIVTMDRIAGIGKIYIDGNDDTDPENTDISSVTGSTDNNDDLGIAARKVSGTPENYFTGSMDAVMIFNKALSQDEIDWLYNSGAGKELCSLAPMLHHRKQLVGV